MTERIGLEAVLETQGFEAGARQYIAFTEKMIAENGKMLASLAAPTDFINQAYAQSLADVAVASSKLGTTLPQAGAGAEVAAVGVQHFSFAAQLTLLAVNLLSAAVIGLSGAFLSQLSAIPQNIADYERLGQSIQAMIGREIRAADSSKSMGDALAEAAPQAKATLQWIEQLAAQSPFTQEGVQNAFLQAQSYGFTAAQAQILTQATIDWASATGRSEFAMNRVTLALGQMNAAGHVTGQDLRQLMEAGIDVYGVLGQMGVSLDDVSKGAVDSNKFIETLVSTLQSDWGGSAAAQATSLAGIFSTLNDLVGIATRKAFMGTFQAIQPLLVEFVNALTAALPAIEAFGNSIGSGIMSIIANRDAIGQMVLALTAAVGVFFLIANASAIASAATAAWAAVTATATFIVSGGLAALLSPLALVGVAVAGLAGLFVLSFDHIEGVSSDFFSGMTSDLFGFGEGLVFAFAQGMAAAIGAVLDVLNAIGSMIASWLSPGSPPKLLPDIDDWGTSAMNEFLQGFSKADFDLLKDLQSPIEAFIRSVGAVGGIAEAEVVPHILAMREALAAAVSEFETVGQVSEQAFANIFSAVGIADPAVQQYVQSMFAAEQAAKAVKDAQDELNAVTAQYAAQLAPIDAELAAIQAQRNAFKESQRTAELEKIINSKRAPAAAKELARMELREIQLKKEREAIEANKKTAEDEARAKLEAAKAQEAAAKAQMEAQRAALETQTETNRLLAEQLKLMERLANQGGAGGGGAGRGGGGGLALPPGGAGLDLGGLAGGGGALGNVLGEWQTKIDEFWGKISAPFAPLAAKLEELKTTWGNVFSLMFNGLNDLWLTYGKPAFDGVYNWVTTNGPIALTELGNIWTGISTGAQTGFTDMQTAIAGLPAWWDGIWSSANTTASTWWGTINTTILTALRVLFASMGLNFDQMSARWTQIWTDLGTIATTLFTAFTVWLGTQLSLLATGVEQVLAQIQLGWTTFWTDFTTHGTEMLTSWSTSWNTAWTDIGTALQTALTAMLTAVGTWASDFLGDFKQPILDALSWLGEQVQTFSDMGGNLLKGMQEGILNASGDLIDAITTAIENAIKEAKKKLGIGSPSKVFEMQVGKPIMQGAILGIEKMQRKFDETLAQAFSGTPNVGNFGAVSTPNIASPAIPMPPTPTASRLIGPPTPGGHRFIGPAQQGGGTGGVNVTFGNVSISNGLTQAAFEARVEQAIRKAITRQ